MDLRHQRVKVLVISKVSSISYIWSLSILFENIRETSSIKLANLLSVNPTKWAYTLKQFVGNLPTNCLSVFNHFVGLVLKGLRSMNQG